MKKNLIFGSVIVSMFATFLFASSSLPVMAASLSAATPELTNIKQVDVSDKVLVVNNPILGSASNRMAASVASAVAMVTIFADPINGGAGGSGGDGSSNYGTHAFITVKNMSQSNINIGKFSGVLPGKTMSIGGWGNKSEHIGLWYNLESYSIYYNSSFPGRVSASYLVTAAQLNTLNSYIINNDRWSLLPINYNCSSFAAGAWNSFVDSSYRLSAGVLNTPRNLSNSIKAKFPGAPIGGAVPYDYLVYFANGTGSPVRSSIYR